MAKNINARIQFIEESMTQHNIPTSEAEFFAEWQEQDDISKALLEECAENESSYKLLIVGDPNKAGRLTANDIYLRTMVKYLLSTGMIKRRNADSRTYDAIVQDLNTRLSEAQES